jgi:hypothetical protein
MGPSQEDERMGEARSQQSASDPAEELPLPKLTHIDPVIFVLAEEDFTRPVQPARDRVERVERILKSIDWYHQAIRANFHHLVRHEKRRVEQSTAAYEYQCEPIGKVEAGVGIEELRAMVTAINAPVDPEMDYNVDATADDLRMWEQFQGEDEPFTKRNGLRQMGWIAEQGVHHIDGFNNHMTALRGKWQAILEREERAIEGFARADDVAMDGPGFPPAGGRS